MSFRLAIAALGGIQSPQLWNGYLRSCDLVFEYIEGYLNLIRFADARFGKLDGAIMNNVLYSFRDDDEKLRILREIWTNLGPGARFV